MSSIFDNMTPEKLKLIRTAVWAATLCFMAIMASMTTLAWFDKDFSSVMVAVGAFVMNALGFLIYGKVAQVGNQVNGNQNKLMDMVDRKTPQPQPVPLAPIIAPAPSSPGPTDNYYPS